MFGKRNVQHLILYFLLCLLRNNYEYCYNKSGVAFTSCTIHLPQEVAGPEVLSILSHMSGCLKTESITRNVSLS